MRQPTKLLKQAKDTATRIEHEVEHGVATLAHEMAAETKLDRAAKHMAKIAHERPSVFTVTEPKIPKRMSAEEAGLIVQKHWRGWVHRKAGDMLILGHEIHLGYEVRVMSLRAERKALASGFVQHLINLALLVTVFFLQHGRSVQTRYTLVETLKSYVNDLETPSGVTFDSISTGDEMWDWTQNALFAVDGDIEGGAGGRVIVRTYNQIVGSVRFETTRVSNDSCGYKHIGWTRSLLKSRRPTLWDSEQLHPECYGYGPPESSAFGPPWDDAKWSSATKRGGEPRYIVDLGRDPTIARLKMQEMKVEDFFSDNSRTGSISFTVYNNALPMLCFVQLLWALSPTGQLTSRFAIEAMTIQEYMQETFYLQVFLEVVLVSWSIWNIAKELMEIHGMLHEHEWGVLGALGEYLKNVWNLIDWVRSVALLVVMSRWIWLVFDTSRDIDLDTTRFVDLEAAALVFRDYTLVYNVIVLMSLFAVLQYTALDDRMALLTRSIYESMSDLVPFMTLFLAFVLVFAMIGHLLYGPLLLEWSTPGNAVVTVLNIITANYLFNELETALDPDDQNSYAVAVMYYWLYFALMMLVLLNIVIAILMDGYASVKRTAHSDVEEMLKYNVGPLLPSLLATWRDRVVAWSHFARGNEQGASRVPWSDERWISTLTTLKEARAKRGLVVRLVSLLVDLKDLPSSKGEDVAWQVKTAFQDRRFKPPSNLNSPFVEPTAESDFAVLGRAMPFQEAQLRRSLHLLMKVHDRQEADSTTLATTQQLTADMMQLMRSQQAMMQRQSERIERLEAQAAQQGSSDYNMNR